jgi:adenylosuccinate lyase
MKRSLNMLLAVSPLDGRYASQVDSLRPFFSEFALMRYRVKVELQWLQKLVTDQIISKDPFKREVLVNNQKYLEGIFESFSEEDGERVKEIEKTTNHDVKAIEYFLKEKFDKGSSDLGQIKEYLHFACTSEDINNLSYALMIQNALREVMAPNLRELYHRLT